MLRVERGLEIRMNRKIQGSNFKQSHCLSCFVAIMKNAIVKYTVAGLCIVLGYQMCMDIYSSLKSWIRVYIEKKMDNDVNTIYNIKKKIGSYRFRQTPEC